MRVLAGLLLIAAGCVRSNSVTCEDGRLCPSQDVCDELHGLCVTPDQLAQCNGQPDFSECRLDVPAGCVDGVCLPAVCGNGRLDRGEVCDDGNAVAGDACSADCKSDESCGNGLTDLLQGETCDDGNHLDHDGCSSTCGAETAHWSRATTQPGARFQPGLTYDAARDRLVLFGGQIALYSDLSDTLEWNGTGWVQRDVAPPQPAEDAMFAYDHAAGRTVLYGGTATNAVGATWVYDGAAWLPADPGTRRFGAGMAYDSARHRLVVFGGNDTINQAIGTTAEWDGSAWSEITTATVPPIETVGGIPNRWHPAMAYDPRRARVVMYGGGDQNNGNVHQDLWEYDGNWHQIAMAGVWPPALARAMMAFDPVSQKIVMFGGIDGAGVVQSITYTWNGAVWVKLSTSTVPPARTSAGLAQDGHGHLVMVGGSPNGTATAVLGDTWRFDGANWSQSAPDLRESAVANDLAHDRVIVFGGLDSSLAYAAQTWELSPEGWTRRTVSGPSARRGSSAVYVAARRNVMLFGGDNGTTFNDTWIWDGTTWTQSPAAAPSPRGLPSLSGEQDGGALLFGGYGTSAPLNETWRWDGSTWTHLAPATSPPPRNGAAMAYDPVRHQVVLFGGFTTTIASDTWVWDGSTWQEAHGAIIPPPRFGASIVWNPARQRLVMLGGVPGTFDAWEWDGSWWVRVIVANPPPARTNFSAVATLDGGGVSIFSGDTLNSPPFPVADLWQLRWTSTGRDETCRAPADLDGDRLVGCSDPDCWAVCRPACLPGLACDPSAPQCGDGTCDVAESCRTCPGDCACTPVCGDLVCDPGETSCPGDCT